MRHSTALFLSLAASLCPLRADDPQPRPVMGGIVRMDPALDALLPADAKLEVCASGRNWSEGPGTTRFKF